MDPGGGLRQRRPERRPSVSVDPARPPSSATSDSAAAKAARQKAERPAFVQRVLSALGLLCGCRVRKAKATNGDSVVSIAATGSLGILVIAATIVFLVPVLICSPEPVYDAGAPPASLVHQLAAASPAWLAQYLPAPPAADQVAARAQCPRFSFTRLPYPACSPVCAPLYAARRTANRAVAAVWGVAASAADLTGIPKFIEIAKRVTARTPPWPLFRLGEPIIGLLHNALQVLIPPDKRLLMYSTGFMHTAVIRAVAKLYVADYIHLTVELRRKHVLEQQPQSVRNSYRGREHEYPLPSDASAVPLSAIAKAVCASEVHLKRLLRAAEVLGLFEESDNDTWKQSAMSNLLRSDHSHSFRGAALMFGGEQYVALSSLHLTVRSGQPAFSEIYGDFWRYHDLSEAEWARFAGDPRLSEAPPAVAPGTDAPAGTCTSFVPAGLKEAAQLTAQLQQQRHIAATAAASAAGAAAPAPAPPNADTTVLPYQLGAPARAAGAPAPPRLNNVRSPVMFAAPEFNAGMTSIAASEGVLVAQDGAFADVDTVVDVAGGRGHLLFEVLTQHPAVSTGIVFDLPRVYADERARSDMSARARALTLRRLAPRTDAASGAAEFGQDRCVWDAATRSPAAVTAAASALATRGETVATHTPATAAPAWAQTKLSELSPARAHAPAAAPTCAEVYVRSGSFFEPETIPRAHAAAAGAVRRRVAAALRALHAAGVDITRPLPVAAAATPASGESAHARAAAAVAASVPGVSLRPDGALAVAHTAAYMMMQILHDWNDKQSVEIVSNLRSAMAAAPTAEALAAEACGGTDSLDVSLADGRIARAPCPRLAPTFVSRLFIVDRILQRHGNLIGTQGSNFADCLMMNNFDDAREREVADMARILEQSSLTLARVTPTRSMYSIVEAELRV